jgi:hypothetical protein
VNDPTLFVEPPALKAMAAALTTVRADLLASGIVRDGGDAAPPVELRIQVLSPEEEVAMRRQNEMGDSDESGDAGDAVASARIAEKPAPTIPTQPIEPQRLQDLPGPLPPWEGFADWLRLVSRR